MPHRSSLQQWLTTFPNCCTPISRRYERPWVRLAILPRFRAVTDKQLLYDYCTEIRAPRQNISANRPGTRLTAPGNPSRRAGSVVLANYNRDLEAANEEHLHQLLQARFHSDRF